MEDTAAAAANGASPEMTTAAPSQQRGHKRARGAQEEHDVAAAAGALRGWPRRATTASVDAAFVETETEEASWFIQVHEAGQENDDEEVRFANQLIDFFGIHLMNDGDDDEKAGSDQDPSDDDGSATAPAGGGDDDASAEFSDGGAPSNNNPSSGGPAPFGFDLNQQLSPEEDEQVDVDDGSAAAAAGDGGAVGFAALDDDANTVRRTSSGGLDFDLNEPCPDGAPDPSDVPAEHVPAPAQVSLAGPDADERPEVPDGGGAPVSRTRRRHLRLWDWAFEWANGLGLGPLGWKSSRRM